MKHVEPEVFLTVRPDIDYYALRQYMQAIGSDGTWLESRAEDDYAPDAEVYAEFAGRACYRSFEAGLNPNVTRIREDRDLYLENILRSGHGSVLEHATFSFAFHNVSRVFTAELNRHRAGVAISEQSMRFVRLDEIPFWFPVWALKDEELMRRARSLLTDMENFQDWTAERFGLDDPHTTFAEKKHKTSFMRRFAPMGVATEEVWTANIRTLRHVIETRTSLAAEEEIRLVFSKVARLMKEELPVLFGDFTEIEPDVWLPKWRKV